VRRREFITLLGGAAAAWPLAARAQQPERMRRIGVLLPAAADDPAWQARFGAFLQAMALLGWAIGRNVHIEVRWATTDGTEIRRHAAELAALAPDVVLAGGTSPVGPLLQATRTVPIVFAIVNDPAGAGFVDSLARPGGNVTGLSNQATDLAAKRLELLRELVPNLQRLAVMANVSAPIVVLELEEVQAAARTLGIQVVTLEIRRAQDIAPAFAALKGRSPTAASSLRSRSRSTQGTHVGTLSPSDGRVRASPRQGSVLLRSADA
jgi:putative ABC transport system substrate-binding protein